ncbi:MAG: mechanosensitive ion channel [Candidatus Thermoplasmatota archaeon]|nr:mechanosensitive ion channel [Candidatus Thermoplasmatota archaeon]
MFEILQQLEPYSYLIYQIMIIVISIIIFMILLKIIKNHLIKKVKTKKQITNVSVFIDLLKFLFIFFIIIIILFTYYGNFSELGFIAGLFSVAVGLALQKPISSVIAWLILTTRRPFDIGDRILISDLKGDITDITLTHIFLDEVGGTIEGEEKSGRIIMIPTSSIFEKEIINYTHQDEYILVEIVTSITYESNLENAENLILKAVEKIMKPYWINFPKKLEKEPHTRLQFKDSGIDISVRYYTLAFNRNKIATDIRREIFNQIKNVKDVEFAYPHTEVLLREKKVN